MNCGDQTPKRPGAFTIVELLVVIAIIALLLAIMAPALSKAVYHSTLTACAAKLKSSCTGVLIYAADFKRFYPDRKLQTVQEMIPPALANGVAAAPSTGGWDLRPTLGTYISINKQLLCPLVEPVDLEYIESPPDTLIYCPYAMYFAWYYRHPLGNPGMVRQGDRWGWGGREYATLIADYELLWTAPTDNISATHPDLAGGGPPQMFQNIAQNIFEPSHVEKITTSIWRAKDSFNRALMDTNYGYDDGSVQQVRNARVRDERYDEVPYYMTGKQFGQFTLYIPR